jgi:hypothetical protein
VTWLPVVAALRLGRPRATPRDSDDAARRGPDLDGYRTVLADRKFASGLEEKIRAARSGNIDKGLNGGQGKARDKRDPGQSSGDSLTRSGAGQNGRGFVAGVRARLGRSGGFR